MANANSIKKSILCMMITMSKLENLIIKNHIYFTENTQKRT